MVLHGAGYALKWQKKKGIDWQRIITFIIGTAEEQGHWVIGCLAHNIIGRPQPDLIGSGCARQYVLTTLPSFFTDGNGLF